MWTMTTKDGKELTSSQIDKKVSLILGIFQDCEYVGDVMVVLGEFIHEYADAVIDGNTMTKQEFIDGMNTWFKLTMAEIENK